MRVWTPPLPEPHFFVQGSGRVLCYRGDAVGERRPSQSLSFQNSPGSQCGPSIYRDLSVWGGGVRQVGSRETRKKVTVAGRQSAQVKEGTYKNHLGIEVEGTISKQAAFSLVFIFHLYNYVFLFSVCVHGHHPAVVAARGQLGRVSFLLPSGSQAQAVSKGLYLLSCLSGPVYF